LQEFCYSKQNILSVRTIIQLQVDDFIRTDIDAPNRIFIYAHKHHEKRYIHSRYI